MPFGKSIVSQVVNFIINVHLSMAWVFPIGFICLLCTVLRLQFQALTQAIQVCLSTSRSNLLRDLATFRRQHLQLCACVRVLDVVFRRLIMTSYVTNVPIICFLLYQLVTSNFDGLLSVCNIYWLINNAFCVVIISLYSAIVHEEAHSALDALFEVQTSGADPDQIVELQLFLSKLTGPPIGFTALGIITVSKETILTLGGLLSTYFFLLVQYRID
ncbi:uncharacterized protein LOC112568716 [Pomacea canaliculata]|uniref:uncharacterized protein LOC112568716 n=1 Tax=Pomacea canaliculata TaxID=400727 RepID=UPI000D7356BB|nr:uncharacterized protein LOC112568716 [Pomacea canaliculata]